MKTDNIKLLIIVLFASCFLSGTALSQEKKMELPAAALYKGPVAVEKVTGTLTLREGMTMQGSLKVRAKNTSDKDEQVSLGIVGKKEEKISVGPRGARDIDLPLTANFSGNPQGTKSVRIGLAYKMNSRFPEKPPKSAEMRVVLPGGKKSLIYSSLPMKVESSPQGAVYTFSAENHYLTELRLVYTSGDVVLEMQKSIEPSTIEKTGPVKVSLNITNTGSQTARGVLLEDNYDSRDFSARGNDFSIYAGEENDRRLLWSKTIDRIPAGGTTTVTYELTAENPVKSISLNAATATINGELVGISNKIRLR